ncbi:MAG: DNA mismatch repair protein MutL, partial [Alphaproteobacteria bacterium]|nr:DNA mismatch repair protein MutL [Alphaproteobacteria bacterium]
GQLVETYILCEGGGELIIIDQHAAHERVTLYRLQQQARERLGGAQRLLTPVIVELSAARAELLAERLELLADLNLEVAPYGGSAFAIHAVPPGLAKADLPALVRDVADELAEGGAGLAGRDIAEHVLATMACHNSIRAHQSLSHYEMRELLRALDGVDFEVCAHGRPVAIRVDQGELERRFHRA